MASAFSKTAVFVIQWIEDDETFYIVALNRDAAQAGYTENNKFAKGIKGRDEYPSTLEEFCMKANIPLDKAKVRFTGRGAKTEFIFASPRGML